MKPIMFSDAMVNAIKRFDKTQTRRVIKARHDWCIDTYNGDVWPLYACYVYECPETVPVKCPYGQPGDRLWVRETFNPHYFGFRKPGYRADWTNPDGVEEPKWSPSIHMPRWASRFTLRVKDVRVERVQDITEADALAEGIERHWDDGVWYYGELNKGHCDPVCAFVKLWDSIYKLRGFGWEKNPWVWVVKFEVVK